MKFTRFNKNNLKILHSFLRFPLAEAIVSVETSHNPADFERKPHYHDYPELWYCHSGSYTHSTEDGVFHCKAGSVVIIPPGTLHHFHIQKSEDVVLTRISLPYDYFTSLDFKNNLSLITYMYLPHLADAKKLCVPAHIVLSEESQMRVNLLPEDDAKRYPAEFFSLPEFALSEEEGHFALKLINKSLVPVVRAMTHMIQNFGNKITSNELADVSSLCRTNFFKNFKKYLGITHTNYLMMVRVSRAQYALVFSEFSLQYISDMCGFATPSYMTKCYKKFKGFSPKHDREKIKIYKEKYPLIHISHDFLKS